MEKRPRVLVSFWIALLLIGGIFIYKSIFLRAAESVPVELTACEKAQNKKLDIKNLEDLLKKKEGLFQEAQKKMVADLEVEVKQLEADLVKVVANIQDRIDKNIKKSNDLASDNQKLTDCKENSSGRLDAAKKDWDKRGNPSGTFNFAIFTCFPSKDKTYQSKTYRDYFDYEKSEAKRFGDLIVENNQKILDLLKLVDDDSKLIISNRTQTDDAKARANRDFLDRWQKLNDAFLLQTQKIKDDIKAALEDYAALEFACESEKFLEAHKNDPLIYNELPVITPEFTLSVEDIIGDLFVFNPITPDLVGPVVDQYLAEINELVAEVLTTPTKPYRRNRDCPPLVEEPEELIDPLVEPDPIEPKEIKATSCADLLGQLKTDKDDLKKSNARLLEIENQLKAVNDALKACDRTPPDRRNQTLKRSCENAEKNKENLIQEQKDLRAKVDGLKDIKLDLSGDFKGLSHLACVPKDDDGRGNKYSEEQKAAIRNHFNDKVPPISTINAAIDELNNKTEALVGANNLDDAADLAKEFCDAKNKLANNDTYKKLLSEAEQFCKK